MEQSKNKRARRTRAELEADVFSATRQLASERGLAQTTFTDIIQGTDIQTSVLFNNYKNIERLLDRYAYISDYWLHDLFDEEHPTDKANEGIMKSTLKALTNYLYDNTDMQRLLAWELEADNSTMRRIARNREKHYKLAIEEYKHLLEGTGVPIDIIAGLPTAGAYYLTLHRRRPTFFSADCQQKENRERLYSTLEYLSGPVFSVLKERNQIIEIARNFKQRGVADDVIAECTSLSVDVVKGLQIDHLSSFHMETKNSPAAFTKQAGNYIIKGRASEAAIKQQAQDRYHYTAIRLIHSMVQVATFSKYSHAFEKKFSPQ